MKLFSIFIGVAIWFCAGVWHLRGQTPAAVSATIQFADGQSVTVTDFSTPVDVQSNEIVNVTFQFTADTAGEPAVVEAPEGGRTSLGSTVAVVNEDGTLHFLFGAPPDTGTKSVSVRSGSQLCNLLFRVLASANQ
jgi:hypothetical protein